MFRYGQICALMWRRRGRRVGCYSAAHPSFVAQRRVGTPRRIPRSVNPSEIVNLPVYFGHGRRSHCPRRGDGQPQGSRAAYQGDPGPHALARHDRGREPPRPSHAPLYGASHDRSCILRGQTSEGSLASWQHFLCRRSHRYPVAQDVVLALMLWSGDIGCFWLYGDGVMRKSCIRTSENSLPGI
jgi:hypothetical protein